MRRAIAVLAVTAALLAAGSVHAASNAKFGIQDDAWLLYGPGTLSQRLATLHGLGVGIVRFTLRWDEIAPSQPADPRDPEDPAYEWGRFDGVLQGLHALGIPALVTLYGTPRWANGGRAPNALPATSGIADFAYAAATRYPWVHMWTIWNEPNGRDFSVPVSPTLYVRRLLNPAYASLHEASSANVVAGGVTSPRKAPSGMAPLAFMQGMRAAHARLDAYAQNPYAVEPGETPSSTPCVSCETLTMAKLSTIRADVTELFGPKPLWLTEYGYQTNPPDRLLGVSWAAQASYVGQAALRVWKQPGATVLIQFLIRDEPSLGGWQSGLTTAAGAPKPSLHAFSLPLAEVARRGARAVLWGQVRPGSGARPYELQRLSGGRWVPLGVPARTGPGGTFLRTVTIAQGTRVRLWSPQLRYASPSLLSY